MKLVAFEEFLASCFDCESHEPWHCVAMHLYTGKNERHTHELLPKHILYDIAGWTIQYISNIEFTVTVLIATTRVQCSGHIKIHAQVLHPDSSSSRPTVTRALQHQRAKTQQANKRETIDYRQRVNREEVLVKDTPWTSRKNDEILASIPTPWRSTIPQVNSKAKVLPQSRKMNDTRREISW